MARYNIGVVLSRFIPFFLERKPNVSASVATLNNRFYSSRHVLRRRAAQVSSKDTSDAITEDSPPEVADLYARARHHLKRSQQFYGEDLENNEKRFRIIVDSLSSRKRREKKVKILLEGKGLIEIAARCGCVPEQVFYSKEDSIPFLDCGDSVDIDLVKVTPKSFRMISGNMEPPSVIAVCKKPVVDLSSKEPALPVTILCSNVKNPDNMGSIINIAATTGCKALLLTKGCVDPWERKVLKAGNAAHFFIPIVNNIEWFDISNHVSKASSVYIADSSADIEIDKSQIFSDVDYYGTRGNDMSVETQTVGLLEESYSKKTELIQVNDNQELPCMLYSSITFPKKDIIIYIGGETEGIDPRAKELVRDYRGMSLKIPLENDMDSLNVCSALSVIVYEIKRQFSSKSTRAA